MRRRRSRSAGRLLSGGAAIALLWMAPSPGARAQQAPTPDDLRPIAQVEQEVDGLPEAVFLAKLTWSAGKGVTRLRFHATRPITPEVTRTNPRILRVDLRAVGAADTPRVMEIGTPEVARVLRVPAALRAQLPPGVSERYLVELRSELSSFTIEREADGCTLLVGDDAKVGQVVRWEGTTSWTADALTQAPASQVAPAAEERLLPAKPFVVGADQPVRVAPSPLSPPMGTVATGQTRIADARRGSWVHLTTGGWIVHSAGLPAGTGTAGRPRATRTPMAWSVLMLGTGLQVDVTEVLPGQDAAAEAVAALFAEKPQLARLDAAVGMPASVGIRLPAKAGRLVLTLLDGSAVKSLDPRALELADESRDAGREAAFTSPLIYPGESFSTYLVLPGDLDFTAVEDARIDVDGKLQRLFRVPGSGEPVEQ